MLYPCGEKTPRKDEDCFIVGWDFTLRACVKRTQVNDFISYILFGLISLCGRDNFRKGKLAPVLVQSSGDETVKTGRKKLRINTTTWTQNMYLFFQSWMCARSNPASGWLSNRILPCHQRRFVDQIQLSWKL